MAIEVTFSGNKKVNALVDGYTIMTDQPIKAGGDDTAPTPFNLFLASLATCAGIYIKGFCDQRELQADKIKLTLEYETDPIQKMVSKFIIRIFVPREFPEKYDQAMINTAALCAVKRHLNERIQNEITVERY